MLLHCCSGNVRALLTPHKSNLLQTCNIAEEIPNCMQVIVRKQLVLKTVKLTNLFQIKFSRKKS